MKDVKFLITLTYKDAHGDEHNVFAKAEDGGGEHVDAVNNAEAEVARLGRYLDRQVADEARVIQEDAS